MSRRSIPSVPLGELVTGIVEIDDVDVSVIIGGISQDSRAVEPGDLFCCVTGATFDGHDFIDDAVAAGARAVLVDRVVDRGIGGVPVIVVGDVRATLGLLAARAFGHPARSLTLVGVTGTNGKTSVTAMLASILERSGALVENIGTLAGARTTPEALDLHAQLADCVERGVSHVVMEVSSHALVLHRVAGLMFERAVFTNLGRDHLDFHGTQEAYFAAKAKLFEPGQSMVGVVNVDDPRGRLLFDTEPIPMVSYSIDDVDDVTISIDSVEFLWRSRSIHVPLGGSFTVMNALAAAVTAESMGVAPEVIERGLATVGSIPGRFESIANDLGVAVVVDYAHTAEGLATVLDSVRPLTDARVIVVFGCGGDRDRGKRPLMGRVAAELADVMIVTSDNPRGEDPDTIIDEIIAGVEAGSRCQVIREVDRGRAVTSAISMAGRGDIVVLAGKGHETVQEVKGRVLTFSDAEQARVALDARGGSRP